jgi:hypothetical protein
MSLARSDLLQQINAGNLGTGSFVPAAFTPPANSYMLVGVLATENSGSAPNPNDVTVSSNTGLTFSKPVAAIAVGASFATYVAIFAAPVAVSASTTLTVSFAGRSISVAGVSVAAWTGYNTGTPTGATATGSQTAGFTTPNPAVLTLTGTPAATSEVWGFIGADKNTADITPGTSIGYTETADQFNGASVNAGFESEVRGSSTSTTVRWDDVRPGGGALFNWGALAVEVLAQTEADMNAALTATGSMSASLTVEEHAAATLTATGSMSASLAVEEHAAATLGASGTMTANLTVVSNQGPQDLIGLPAAQQLLSCLTSQLQTLPKPPALIQLRAGAEGGPLIGPNVDECCAGLAWVRIANIYPSWDNFPAPDITWLPCGPLAYAVVLEMGVAFCMPWSDSDDSFDNIDPPNEQDWANAAITQMQHQTLMRKAAACCFHATQRRAVGEWLPLSVEGGCTGGTMRVTVSVMAPCSDC